MGSLWLTPTALLVAVPFALLGAAALETLKDRNGARRSLFAGLTAVFAGTVAAFVATGRHLSAPERRAGFTILLAGIGGSVAYFAQPRLARFRLTRPSWFALVASAAFVAVELANRFLLV